jgi:hypothetical protein
MMSPGYHNTKLDATYGPDYNFDTGLQFQFTFSFTVCHHKGSSSKVRYQCQPISWLKFFDVSLTFPAQAQRFSRADRMFDKDPSQGHSMFKDFETRKFPMYPESNHVYNNLPDDRPRKYKFEYGDPANQVELFGSVGQFQFQVRVLDLEDHHKIDIVVDRVCYICDEVCDRGNPVL